MISSILPPYNKLQVTITIDDTILTYEIPPCEFTGIDWVDTSPNDFENAELKQAIQQALPAWTTEVKEAYKTYFLESYIPIREIGMRPVPYEEIEALLNKLIQQDQLV